MNNPMQHRSWILGIIAILLGLAVVTTPSAQAQTFTTFDAPGAGTGALQGTFPISINTTGTVAGIYSDASNLTHGFVRAANGTITDFDAPGAGTGKNQGTFPVSINTAGVIAGYYSDAENGYHGFVRATNGSITTIDVSGAVADWHLGTAVTSINTAGVVTGIYRDTSYVHHGFVRAANGTITSFDVTGAHATYPLGINTAGIITGTYIDTSGANHGFVRAANGTITSFDAPAAGTGGTLVHGTAGIGINTAGAITGAYTDASGLYHGFVRAANGTITEFDAKGASAGPGTIQGTLGISINTAGIITGGYMDASYVAHGFVRAANGTITPFDAPGAGSDALLTLLTETTKGPPDQGTGGFSINTAGVITGTYFDASGVLHGFLMTPAAATTTTLTSLPNPSTYGQTVMFTAAVTSKAGAPPDGETVSFMKGKTVLGTGTLSGGSATFTTSTLKVGTNSITAVYAGDSNFATSTSKAVKQVVSKAATTTALASSQNPSSVGQSVTFTASVAPEFSGTPTGKVAFYDGTTLLQSVALSGGVAKYTTSTLTSGTHTITATYNGSTSFDGSSASLTQTVD
jgi:predicted membrane protein